MEQKVTTPVVKGLIISLILIVLSLVAHYTDQSQSTWAKWLPMCILLGGIIYSCILFANQMDGNVTFGNVFANGFKTGAVITCLMVVFTVAFFLLDPSIKEQAMEAARTEMQKNDKMTDAEIEKSMSMVENFMYVGMIGGIIVIYLIISVIAALLGAAFAKKNPNPTPFQQ
jgi:hypothetical protein